VPYYHVVFTLPAPIANIAYQNKAVIYDLLFKVSELFRAACRMGLEGLVSKHRERPYQAGRSKHCVKVKNRKHPAMYRVMD
jgi:ATP-dependent DNA ligase